MSDSNQPEKPAAAPAATQSPAGSGGTITAATILSALLGVLGAAAGAGWPGVVALVLVGVAVPFGWNTIIGIANGWTDQRDQDRAGADPSKTALDLANQGRKVSDGLDAAETADPPSDDGET